MPSGWPSPTAMSQLRRGLIKSQRNRVAAHDELSADCVDRLRCLLDIFDLSKEVWALDVQAGAGLFVQLGNDGIPVGFAVLGRHQNKLVAGGPAVGLDHLDGVGVGGGGAEDDVAATLAAHVDRFGRGGSAVIDRGVGDVHAGQLADHGLVLKDGLQHALADLSLIGGVGGDKFFLAGHALDDGRDVVVVSAGAAEDRIKDDVLRGDVFHGAADFQLGFAGGEVELPFELERIRNVGEQLVDGAKPDRRQHLLPLLRSGRNVRSHTIKPPCSATPHSRKQTAVLPCRKCRPPESSRRRKRPG